MGRGRQLYGEEQSSWTWGPTAVVVLVVAAFCFIAWLAAAAPPDVQAEGVAKEVRQDSALGKNRDQRGCLQAAGYVWCEGAGKCIRPWKESCPGGTEFCKDYCSKQSKDQPKLRAGAGSHSVYCRCMDNGEAAEYKPKTSGSKEPDQV
mmetsp:Transcript_17778/g.28495  ORF Transcript_17778/g.28495 Transcript_17778/m.28495 type:complete len:148 (+) Transcript_17778:99-542(+)